MLYGIRCLVGEKNYNIYCVARPSLCIPPDCHINFTSCLHKILFWVKDNNNFIYHDSLPSLPQRIRDYMYSAQSTHNSPRESLLVTQC